ncbi:MAG TPA: sucrase ferredoxin [Anaerolineales bacterium]|nr:sucrase ferredoxin [Anaerolineales bacterium]
MENDPVPALPTAAFFCSNASLTAGETLHGTAKRGRVWFLLEYRGAWGQKAFEESSLPPEVKSHLESACAQNPDCRILLIRQPATEKPDALRFFVVLSDDADPVVYRFELPDYAALTQIDLNAVIQKQPAFEALRWNEPLFLVCTNGRRDACCAKFGLPVFQAAFEQAGAAVWQSSHVGGHRFAAILLCFPHGLYYGRLGVGDVAEVILAYERGELRLPYLRGRASYPQPAQAAEILLRRQTGELQVDAYRLQNLAETQVGVWQADFMEPTTGRTHRIAVQEDEAFVDVYESCNREKIARRRAYRPVE